MSVHHWRPRGAAQKSGTGIATDRRPSHSQIFFPRSEFLGTSRRCQRRKPSLIKGAVAMWGTARLIYFLHPPGVGQSSVTLALGPVG
jgi:hypothetical protein